MTLELLRLWLARLLAIILAVMAVDSIARAGQLLRLANEFRFPRSPLNTVMAGISVTVYVYLALTLWHRPASVFPIPDDSAAPERHPASTRDWIRVGGAVIGIYLIASGLISVVAMAFSSGADHLLMFDRSNSRAIVSIIVGLVVYVSTSGFLAGPLRAMRGALTRALLVTPEDEAMDRVLEEHKKGPIA